MSKTAEINDDVFEYDNGFSQCISGFGRNAIEDIEDVATRNYDLDPVDRERMRWHVMELVRWCRALNGELQRERRKHGDQDDL